MSQNVRHIVDYSNNKIKVIAEKRDGRLQASC
jgi:hypothetical protein